METRKQLPDSWKVARITLIFIDGDRTEICNYCPVCLACHQLFEGLIFQPAVPVYERNWFLSSDQSGFLRLHSTLTCLLKMSDDWYNGLHLGKLFASVFIDLKEAFDTLNQNILCQKLKLDGVRQRMLSWFKPYLSNRKQFCGVNCDHSDFAEIEVGVPRGPCLGPLLFLIYINDPLEAVQGSSVTMYADGSSLCHQSHYLTQLNEAINSDLSRLDT